jgi:hypothetical protein
VRPPGTSNAAAYASWAAEVVRKQLPKSVVIEMSCLQFADTPETQRTKHLSELALGIIHELIPLADPDSPTLKLPRFEDATVGKCATLNSQMGTLTALAKEISPPNRVILVIGNIEVLEVCGEDFDMVKTALATITEAKWLKIKNHFSYYYEAGRLHFRVLSTHAANRPEHSARRGIFRDESGEPGRLEQVEAKSMDVWPRQMGREIKKALCEHLEQEPRSLFGAR